MWQLNTVIFAARTTKLIVMTIYVSTWDFEIEDSGDVVKDGLVFGDIGSAKREANKMLIASLDFDFASRAKPITSRRLGKAGYVVGNVKILAVQTSNAMHALQEALAGRGSEVTD